MFFIPLLTRGIRTLRHWPAEGLDWSIAATWCCWSFGRLLYAVDWAVLSGRPSRDDAMWSRGAHQNQGYHLADNTGVCLHGAQCLLGGSSLLVCCEPSAERDHSDCNGHTKHQQRRDSLFDRVLHLQVHDECTKHEHDQDSSRRNNDGIDPNANDHR